MSDLTSCKPFFDYVKTWWDFFKESHKNDTIVFSRKKHKRLCHERVSLTNRIIKLKHQLLQGFSAVSYESICLESCLIA